MFLIPNINRSKTWAARLRRCVRDHLHSLLFCSAAQICGFVWVPTERRSTETQQGRDGTPARGGCVQEMEVVNVLFCLPGFLIQLQFITPPPCFFEVDLIYFAFYLFICFMDLILDRGGGGCGVKLDELFWFVVCGLEVQMDTLNHRSSQISERRTHRRNNILTFRWLLLDVRPCQVPVDQRRLTAGQVTHNALGKRDQLMSVLNVPTWCK